MASGEPPSDFAPKRAKLASQMMDAQYKLNPKLNARKHRMLFAVFVEMLNEFHLEQIGDMAPKNAHLASIHSTQLDLDLKNASVNSFNYLLATMCEPGQCEDAVADTKEAAALAQEMLDRVKAKVSSSDDAAMMEPE